MLVNVADVLSPYIAFAVFFVTNAKHHHLPYSPISDIISGAIMAATSVPQLIAYAELVGYAGYRGLSTAGAPLLAWGVATGKLSKDISNMHFYTRIR